MKTQRPNRFDYTGFSLGYYKEQAPLKGVHVVQAETVSEDAAT